MFTDFCFLHNSLLFLFIWISVVSASLKEEKWEEEGKRVGENEKNGDRKTDFVRLFTINTKTHLDYNTTRKFIHCQRCE